MLFPLHTRLYFHAAGNGLFSCWILLNRTWTKWILRLFYVTVIPMTSDLEPFTLNELIFESWNSSAEKGRSVNAMWNFFWFRMSKSAHPLIPRSTAPWYENGICCGEGCYSRSKALLSWYWNWPQQWFNILLNRGRKRIPDCCLYIVSNNILKPSPLNGLNNLWELSRRFEKVIGYNLKFFWI